MSWFRIEGRMPHHRKVAPLSDAAFRLYISAGCWSVEERTEGKIPSDMPGTFARAPRGKALPKAIAELTSRGLWEAVVDGYQIHDFLEYNLSNADSDSLASKRSDAGKLGAKSRWGTDSKRHGKKDGKRHGKRMANLCPDTDTDTDTQIDTTVDVVSKDEVGAPPTATKGARDDLGDTLVDVPRPGPPSRVLVTGHFAMTDTWDPGPVVLMGTSVPLGAHSALLARFRPYWRERGDERTQTRWRATYVAWAVDQHNRDRAQGRKGQSPPRMGDPDWRRQPDSGALNLSDYLHDPNPEASNG